MESLHDLIRDKFTKYSNDDYEWCHYVADCYNRVRENAQKIVINPYKLNVYKYRLSDFLAECNIPPEVEWIVLLINQLRTERDFEGLTWMYIPNMADIELMRQEYETVRAHAHNLKR